MVVDNPAGNFKFLKGFGPFSFGTAAHPGHEIVHARFRSLPPLQVGYGLIERHLSGAGRPLHALCGMELRLPKSLTFPAFKEFNRRYTDQLARWNLEVDGQFPPARSNIAFAFNPVPEPAIYGFSYTLPTTYAEPTFVLAGVAEVKLKDAGEYEVVSAGDVSTEGLRHKAEQVLGALTANLGELKVGWSHATGVDVYTVHDIHPLLATVILPALHEASRNGIRWHYARPPVIDAEFEVDVRGVRQELVL